MLFVLACLGLSAASEDESSTCAVTIPGSVSGGSLLPDPFKKIDGTRITKKSDWLCRKAEIRKLAEKYAYGEKKTGPTTTGTVSSSLITVSVSAGGRSASFSASVSMPLGGAGPAPAVIVYGGFGADTGTMKSAGAAIINYDPFTCGREGTGRAAKSGAYYTVYGSSKTGYLAAWGWGVSRIIDVIAASGGTVLKATGIGVSGCSRYGKGAFVAGALDDRVALTLPVESGTGGAQCWRCIAKESGSQPLNNAYNEQPWFGDDFPYSNPTSIPVDTHEVIGLVAPRGIFLMDNPHIEWLGARCGALAALGGQEIFKALGVAENIVYWSDVTNGNHCSTRTEWTTPITQFVKKFLGSGGTTDGKFHISASKSVSLSSWRDWETPTLA